MGAPKTVQRQITTHFGPQEGRRGLASAKLSNCPAKTKIIGPRRESNPGPVAP